MSHLSRTALQHGKDQSTCPPYSHKVLWDRKNRQFYLTIEGDKAFIKYNKCNGVIDLFHTEVPEKFRGHGVAKTLAKGTFELIKENNLLMQLSCGYLQSYYKKNKTEELTNLLVEEE